MVVVGSMDRTSEIFHNPGCAAFTEGPQVLERVEPRAVTGVPADGDGVVAHAGDRAGVTSGRTLFGSRRGRPLISSTQTAHRHANRRSRTSKSFRWPSSQSTDSVRVSRRRKPIAVVREPDGRMALSTQRGSPLPVSQVHANGFSPVVGSPWRRPANSVSIAR